MTPPRRRIAVLLLWLALLAAAGWQIAHTRFVADLSAFLPAHPDPQQRVLIEQLQSGVPARTLLMGIDGGAAKSRADASRALAAALRASGLFEQVQNGQTDDWAATGSWLFDHRYQLSPAVDAARFTPAGLRAGIAETLSLLGTPMGNAIKPLLDRDPTGETQRIAENLIPAGAPRSEEGVWVSRNAQRALLVAIARAPGADLDAQAAAIARVRSAFAADGAASAAGLRLQLSGAPVMGVDSRARIESEIRWLAIAGTVLMSTLLLLAFASLPALAVAMLPVASGVVAGIAAVSLVFGSVHGITLGFGTTLIGEAVDYAIYYLIQARTQAPDGWRHWLRSGWPTVRLGLLTSVCGFAALVFSGFPGLAQLGLYSVAGLFGAAAATRWVLPVLMPDGARGSGARRALGRVGAGLVAVLPRLRWLFLAAGVAAAALLLQRGHLWQAELSSLSPIPKSALDLDASLRADLSAGDARTLVVVQAGDLEATLRGAEAVVARLEPLVDRGAIGGVDSVTRWLPSQATQAARRAALPERAALEAALAQATRGGPMPAARLAPFVDAVEAARKAPPITFAALRGTALAPLIDVMLLERADHSWVALLPVSPVASTPAAATAAKADPVVDLAAVDQALTGLPGTQTLEIGPELRRLYARYLGQAQLQALLGALGVVALIAFALRDWRRVLAVCQPLLLAVLLTMGGLAACGIQLGILHLVGLLLVVAVGSNYALFFDLLQRRAGTEPEYDTLGSLLLANLTTVGSFGLIAMSSIPALSAIGRVVAPGALLALLLSAAFAPPRGAGRRQAADAADTADAMHGPNAPDAL
ncbi:MAG: MMPL family transporter [Burkholderiales bacterium]|nr:MMPL family transporter [Burkholderiales bacterium]